MSKFPTIHSEFNSISTDIIIVQNYSAETATRDDLTPLHTSEVRMLRDSST